MRDYGFQAHINYLPATDVANYLRHLGPLEDCTRLHPASMNGNLVLMALSPGGTLHVFDGDQWFPYTQNRSG